MGDGEALNKRVVIIDVGYDSYDLERTMLAQCGAGLECYAGNAQDRDAKMAFARGAAGMFVRGTLIDGAFLDAVPSVCSVVRYGVGYDNVDLVAASARGVKVCNVQGYANHSVSDHALALILACLRGLRQGSAQLREHYGKPPCPRMPDLCGLTLGIVGLGRIGGTLCAKARGLFRHVVACDPYIAPERFAQLGAVPRTFPALLAESDAISIHCNLTEETRRLFDAAAFAQTKPGAIVVNTARGPVVDEDALLVALKSGRLSAAGADVFEDEPPGSNRDELLALPRFIGTGHYAWFSSEASQLLQRRAAENMTALLRGEIPEDCLNP